MASDNVERIFSNFTVPWTIGSPSGPLNVARWYSDHLQLNMWPLLLLQLVLAMQLQALQKGGGF